MKEYKIKYHFLNCSRQSRLLGRWVKLSKDLGEKWYLDFIPVTKKRMLKSINFLNNKSYLHNEINIIGISDNQSINEQKFIIQNINSVSKYKI